MRRLVLVGAVIAAGVLCLAAAPAWANYVVTPNCVTGGQTVPCASGWYTSSVELYWTWSGSGGTASPGTCVTQSFAGNTATEAFCDVTGPDGSADIGQYINVETSSPTATVVPSRAADSNGWYNHPVAGAINGSSFSGIASCTSTTYAGPNTTSATVTGTCTDNAGKTVTVTSAPFAYDATAPSLAATATPGDESVALNWQAGGDIAPIVSMTVARTSSAGTAGDPVVYSGVASAFTDTHLTNGVRYTYTITAEDAAGNTATRTVQATPGARLLSPAANARVTAPPTLSWTAVPGATYYNVQLYRGDPTKLLSLWPAHASLKLRRTWRFDGCRYRLRPGRYTWYVWPGFGKRKASRYGHMVGSGTFVVVR
jgi:hypothetical protein